jgi:transposase InsO family protein
VDDHSRLAYSELLPDEKAERCAAFLRRTTTYFRARGIVIQRLLTDNARMYHDSAVFRSTCSDLGIEQRFIRPRRPQTNGKVCERYNRTFPAEWA